MKKLLLMVCILITVNTYSQPFASFEGTTNGFAMTVGVQTIDGIQISAGYNKPLSSSEKPTLFYGNAGYNIFLSNYDEDNFTLTPTIGAAQSSVKVFDVNDNSTTIKDIKPIYGLELGKDWNMGRLFISANKCIKMFYGIGIKAFFK